MSYWTHILGTVTIDPMGETQAEKRYMVETALAHLPLVTGTEDNMFTHVIQRGGINEWHSHDEFSQYSQQAQKRFSKRGIEVQSEYIIVVEGDLRDRKQNETVREFTNWLCRLSKRIMVEGVTVSISSSDKDTPCIITDENGMFHDMYEKPSWCRKDKSQPPDSYNWCEYLLFDHASIRSTYPLWLAEKYGYENPEETLASETERRRKFRGW